MSLHNALHTRRFTVRGAPRSGWEVRDENDGGILKHVFDHDWHRVERAMALFSLETESLRSVGWVEEPTI